MSHQDSDAETDLSRPTEPQDAIHGLSTELPTFGRVTHPPFRDRTIPEGQTWAWFDLGQRTPLGAVMHTIDGTLWGTDSWFRYNPTTGRWPTGLTDYGIGGATDGELWDGVILRWNDPRGRRSGHANGGSDGLEGDGVLFVRHLGTNAINRDLVSIERSDGGHPYDQPISPKQFASMAHLTAHWFDQAEVPYDRFPLNPHAGPGLVTHLWHLEFATKGCPWGPVVEQTDELQDEIRAILKAAQAPTSDVPAQPPAPDHDAWPGGYTVPRLADQFGRLLRSDGRDFGFHPDGVISNAWANRGATERLRARELPKPIIWHQLGAESGDVIVFERDWVLYRVRGETAWLWVN